jgi:hypothetical protein
VLGLRSCSRSTPRLPGQRRCLGTHSRTRRVFPTFEPHSSISPSLMVPQRSATTIATLKMTRIVDLPLEILLEILSYNTIAQNRLPTPLHPLNAVASTNKHLYSVVEEYSRGLLKRYTNFTPPKSSKTFSCRKKWLAEICQFCKRKSQRRAILYAGLTVCRLCDKQYFPKMVRLLPLCNLL